MRLHDQLTLSGIFTLNMFRDGALVETVVENNLIVQLAKNQLAHLIAGDGADRHITRIGFGVGSSPATPNDTGLTSSYVKAVGVPTYPAAGQVRFPWSLSTSEANGKSITEFGLICADGRLFARKVRAPIDKQSDLSLTGHWTILF